MRASLPCFLPSESCIKQAKRNRVCGDGAFFKGFSFGVFSAKPYSVEHRSLYCRDYSKNNYIEQFFVGLLEGDGTITTNINSSKTIRVRIVIALKNEINNHIMLNKIQNIIGGRVIIERKEKYVT
jgi:hypothetical protein